MTRDVPRKMGKNFSKPALPSGQPKSNSALCKSNKVGLTGKTNRSLLPIVTVEGNLPMLLASLVAVMTVNGATDPPAEVNDLVAGHFRWTVGSPLVSPANRPDDPCHAIKDPSIVFYENRWHLFATIRCQQRTHQIEHLSFTGWKDADKAERQVLRICDGYFLRAAGLLFFAAQKMVPDLPDQRTVAQAGAPTGLLHRHQRLGPGFVEQADPLVRHSSDQRHQVDRLLGHLR